MQSKISIRAEFERDRFLNGICLKVQQFQGKMFQCVRCPSAYHFYGEGDAKSSSTECVPAGSVLIAGRNIICPAHFKVNNSFHYVTISNTITYLSILRNKLLLVITLQLLIAA